MTAPPKPERRDEMTDELVAKARAALEGVNPIVDGGKLVPAMAAEIERLRKRVADVESDRAYIIGANDGWEAACEQGVTSEAVKSAMVRFWKRLVEVENDRAEAAEAKLARAMDALRPFADAAKHRAADAPEWSDGDSVSVVVRIGDLRATIAAIKETQE